MWTSSSLASESQLCLAARLTWQGFPDSYQQVFQGFHIKQKQEFSCWCALSLYSVFLLQKMFSKRICCCRRKELLMMKTVLDQIIPLKAAWPCRRWMKMLPDTGGCKFFPRRWCGQLLAGRHTHSPACCVMHRFYSRSVSTGNRLEVREKWQSLQKLVEVFITVTRKSETKGEVKNPLQVSPLWRISA